ncbi:MAG: hypothetical protein AAF327_03860 [Cyanobacteria bacterium P01_A01_bin.37]
MPLKLVEQFDSSFTLDPDAKEALLAMLTNDKFYDHILAQMQSTPNQSQSAGQDEGDRPQTTLEFTGMLFQPVPYTPTETKGMPAAYEKYHNSPDYLIINVPPNVMFKAKIFKPSRLCAIYKKC